MKRFEKTKRSILASGIAALLCVGALVGCGGGGATGSDAASVPADSSVAAGAGSSGAAESKVPDQASSDKSSEKASADKADGMKTVTVTTSFLEDMVSQIAPDLVKIELIIPAGEDPHLYLAKPEDIEKISKADLLLYHGLHFEGKMQEALENKGVAVTENFTDQEVGKMEEDGTEVIDPHFWFDIPLYKKATANAAKALEELLPDQAETIAANAKAYDKKLDELDAANKAALDKVPKDGRYLITPHDAFNYFARHYDFTVVAPQGVSTESEVSTQDIGKTVDFIVEHKVPAIFAESTTDPARMEKLKEACKAKGFDVTVVSGEGNELFSDSLAPKGQPGDTYIDMYKHNVDLISKYLAK